MNKTTLDNISTVLEQLDKMSGFLSISNLQQVLKDLKGIIDSPTDLMVYYETDFQLTNELHREVDPDSDLFKETMEKVEEYYSDGEGINEAVASFLTEKAPCVGDTYEFWTNDLPRYMINPQFGCYFQQHGKDGASRIITLEGFHKKEEIKALLEKALHVESHTGDLAFVSFLYYGRNKNTDMPNMFRNKEEFIKSLMIHEDDELFTYSCGYCPYYAIKDKHKDDLAGTFEDTFDRIVDEYGIEAVKPLMGAVPEDETEDTDAFSLDQGYVIPNFNLLG